MANLLETVAAVDELDAWVQGIYQLEQEDLVLGGADGIDNLQAKQLLARSNWLKSQVLGLGAGKQPLDDMLTALSALVTAADQTLYFTGPDAPALTALTAFARTLLAANDAAAARVTLDAASPADVAAAIAALVASSPATLDTLNELAAALGNDANFATTVTNALALKAPLARLGNFNSFGVITANTTLTGSDCGKAYRCGSSGYAITLPLIADVQSGSAILLKHTGTAGDITIQRQGTDTISVKGDSITSFTISNGDSALLVRSGVDWTLIGGEAALSSSSAFINALALKAPLNSPAFAGAPTAQTPPQFDASPKLATTEFVALASQRFAGNVSYAASTALTNADFGKVILLSGIGTVITLPAVSASNGKHVLTFFNGGSNNVTIQRAGTNVFYPDGGTTSVVLGQYDTLVIESDGNNGWNTLYGSAQLIKAAVFGNSLNSSGYQKLPSGLIIQWGYASATTGGNPVTFPIAFPTACLYAGPGIASTSSIPAATSPTTTGFTFYANTGSSSHFWLAIGK